MALKSIFIFYSLQKRLKKQFFGAEYNFFVNVARFARKHFLAYPKLVGTPCIPSSCSSSSTITGAKYSTWRHRLVPMQRWFYSQGRKYHQMRLWKLDGRNTHLPTGLLPFSRIHRRRKSIVGGKHGTLRLQAIC